MFSSRIARSVGLAAALAAVGTATATAAPTDLRTPDAVAAGQAQVERSVPADLRTPDARDHGEGRGTYSTPGVTVYKVVPAPQSTGFDWTDAGIGAGGLLGLILVGAGGTFAVQRRQGPRAATV